MKILLSAYACEPNRGSEPGIGWNWARELAAMGHEVWVITRANNRSSIERDPTASGMRFEYVELPPWLRWWKKGNRGIQLYYFLWQIAAFFRARNLVKATAFDLVQHVSFVSARQPSFMGNLGIPFVFGPVAGGESAPLALRKSYPLQGKLWDGARDLMNSLIRWDPMMWHTFARARWIVATSEQTRNLIPRCFHAKSMVHLAIGISMSRNASPLTRSTEQPLRILYVGKLLYLKGIHLALRAFAQFYRHAPQSCFTIVGDGPDEAWLKEIARQNLPESAITWIKWVDQKALMSLYPAYDAFVFPSLHDSGGMVVLEAMSCGLPVIALDLGGPGMIVDSSCGFRIQTERKSEADVIEEIHQAMRQLQASPERFTHLSKGAIERAECFAWEKQVQALYEKVLP